jgi:hypothetical protein
VKSSISIPIEKTQKSPIPKEKIQKSPIPKAPKLKYVLDKC